jgi:hypothetical protein
MHQSPLKQIGAPRREKYAAFEALEGDAEAERRLYRGTQPKARKFHPREDDAREERSRQHPRG